jgi:hypothetical protein
LINFYIKKYKYLVAIASKIFPALFTDQNSIIGFRIWIQWWLWVAVVRMVLRLANVEQQKATKIK